jgi:hypothetical protein
MHTQALAYIQYYRGSLAQIGEMCMMGGNIVRKLDVKGRQKTNEAATVLGFKSQVSGEPKILKWKVKRAYVMVANMKTLTLL